MEKLSLKETALSLNTPQACDLAVQLAEVMDQALEVNVKHKADLSRAPNLVMAKYILAQLEEQEEIIQGQNLEIKGLHLKLDQLEDCTKDLIIKKVTSEVQTRFTQIVRDAKIPEDTLSLEKIRNSFLPGVSKEKISVLLNLYNHPKTPWIGTRNGADFETVCFKKEGLNLIVEQILLNSQFVKTTSQRITFKHPGLGEDIFYVIGRDGVEKELFVCKWLKHHPSYKLDADN